MAHRNRFPCFVCNQNFNLQRMSRIDQEDNINIRETAITRRNARDLPAIEITGRTRLCFNCRQSINAELQAIEGDAGYARFNVLMQRTGNSCFVCNAENNLRRLSLEARIQIFVERDIYVPEYTKTCLCHLTNDNTLLSVLLPGLAFINRPYKIPGQDIVAFFQSFRNRINKSRDFGDDTEFTDDEFKSLTSLNKGQFRELLTFCDPVPEAHCFRYVYRKDLIVFLCKICQGLSDDFLRVIFRYSTRQAVSMAIQTVRRSLMQRFVQENVGFQSITREEYIARHVTAFANELYNPEPHIPRVITCVDGTYSYIDKSSNFRALRQSFCLFKGCHLVKPALFVAPDGFILAVQGPYFSDSRNNDARMLINEFDTDIEGMRAWLQPGDIFIVDRGYRDAGEYLTRLGFEYKMPHLLEQRVAQFTTEEANENRLITKTRWVIESRNGHIKTIFKFFDKVIETPHVPNLQDFYKIAAALINKFHPPIEMADANIELARRMLEKSRQPNAVQRRVEEGNLRRRRTQWVPLRGHQVQFPHLSIEYLRQLTFGTYQITLAPSYVQDKLQHEDIEEFQLDELIDDPRFLHVRVYSRFRNSTKHEIFITFSANVEENVDNNDERAPIEGYYCTCKSGARTLGTCAHVASVLWYLGYARYQENVHYPSTRLINTIEDAGNRAPQINPNDPRIIEG